MAGSSLSVRVCKRESGSGVLGSSFVCADLQVFFMIPEVLVLFVLPLSIYGALLAVDCSLPLYFDLSARFSLRFLILRFDGSSFSGFPSR